MDKLSVLPDGVGSGFSGPELDAKRNGLRKVAAQVAFSGAHIFSAGQDDVPFGFGLDMSDVQEWLVFDRMNQRWAGAHWERGLFDRWASFVTDSFSDGCLFFLAEFGRWGGLFDMLLQAPGAPRHIYADAIGTNAETGQMEIDMRAALESVKNRFLAHEIAAEVSGENELVGLRARLFQTGDAYCLEALDNKNSAYFSSLGLALKGFVLVARNRFAMTPDAQSLFWAE